MLTENDIRAALAATIVNFDAAALPADRDFYDAGIDSLDYANLLLNVQERHGLTVPDEALSECRSIGGLLAYANRQAR